MKVMEYLEASSGAWHTFPKRSGAPMIGDIAVFMIKIEKMNTGAISVHWSGVRVRKDGTLSNQRRNGYSRGTDGLPEWAARLVDEVPFPQVTTEGLTSL